jgi:hypothetical protein
MPHSMSRSKDPFGVNHRKIYDNAKELFLYCSIEAQLKNLTREEFAREIFEDVGKARNKICHSNVDFAKGEDKKFQCDLAANIY